MNNGLRIESIFQDVISNILQKQKFSGKSWRESFSVLDP